MKNYLWLQMQQSIMGLNKNYKPLKEKYSHTRLKSNNPYAIYKCKHKVTKMLKTKEIMSDKQ